MPFLRVDGILLTNRVTFLSMQGPFVDLDADSTLAFLAFDVNLRFPSRGDLPSPKSSNSNTLNSLSSEKKRLRFGEGVEGLSKLVMSAALPGHLLATQS
ncbi:Os02g0693450 [Oryza sativa Japonica Group]|uniref:Os02g0693450 protein n=1 Tax=Oryza sativa subsp. japonica TaxID=39947 RepID=A0A0N7KFX0_ORYSJ|nr:Os02g0693450 [Oryza sativa Japonica Group]